MSWKDHLPPWMKDDSSRQEAAAGIDPSQAVPAPSMSALSPTIVVGTGGSAHDQNRTDQIVEALVAAVPNLKDLLMEADKIKDAVPDVQTRISVVMRLKGISSQGAVDIVAELKSALVGVRQTGETELQTAKTSNIDEPNKQIDRNEERKAVLMQEIATLDQQTGALRRSVETAVQEIAHESGIFQASLAQAQAWIGNIAVQLGVKN